MTPCEVDAAFEYAYPLHAVAHTRWRAVQDPAAPRRHAPNSWRHERGLADAGTRWITAPNNDTLYSNAWVDLSRGPVTVRVDAMPAGRYWSVAMMDAWTNHFAILGQRADGCGPVQATLVGPGWRGPLPAGRVIHAPGQDAWLFARCLVDGPADLPQAHAMQERLSLDAPPGPWDDRVPPGPATEPANFLDVVNEALGRNPPPAHEAPLLARWWVLGLRPGERGVWDRLPPGAQGAWRERVVPAHDALRQAGARGRRLVQGWVTAGPEIGDFGAHHALRASVALGGLGALPPAEAMYFVRLHDDAGQPLDGRAGLALVVPPPGVPADGFWSFSMYRPQAGQRYFVDNPIARYALGNRTPGLSYEADGSLVVWLGHEPPADARLRANWLPAPAGAFQLSLRCYGPRPELRALQASMPRIVAGLG